MTPYTHPEPVTPIESSRRFTITAPGAMSVPVGSLMRIDQPDTRPLMIFWRWITFRSSPVVSRYNIVKSRTKTTLTLEPTSIPSDPRKR